jgi:hypothetical protein
MIYAYKYLTHRIENFHANIAHFFEQLFANDLAVYDENVLIQAGFIPIVNRSRVSLKQNLEAITLAYHGLLPNEKLVVQQAFQLNRNVQNLCNDPTALPVKFDALPNGIRVLLKDFLTMLWENFPQNALLEGSCGTVQEHFNSFVASTHQQALICPFCGLNKLKTSESINRDAYDHYIPKAFYPFISINFQNLFPICHECNSDEKKATDTLYNGAARRQVFYPFDTTYLPNQLSISVTPTEAYNPINFKTLLYDINWAYTISLAGNADPRLISWDEIFHIKRRYTENVLRYQTEWYDELVMRYKRELGKGTLFNAFMTEIIEDAEYMKLIAPFGMLRHSYFTFLFSIPDFETKLNETIN